MSFESFYGGRIGASFIIVKRFDEISVPENTEYVSRYYAYDVENDKFFAEPISDDEPNTFKLIEKTHDTYLVYSNWKIHTLDGEDVDAIDVNTGNSVVVRFRDEDNNKKPTYKEGMVQCFMKGGDTANKVNYGEYVIIDTINKNNPDNGKVYRRGMNYVLTDDNPLAGAEYIGQIVGPQGESPEIGLDHYDIIEQNTHLVNPTKISYVVSGEESETSYVDLVPGCIDTEHFNDDIKLIYGTAVDEFNNISGCLIGFKIPYLMNDFSASSISPYNQPEDLISKDPEYYNEETHTWEHPFFHKWQLKVPHGIHGMDASHFEIVHTKTMPAGYKFENYEGAHVYNTANENDPTMIDDQPLVLMDSVDVLRESTEVIYDADDETLPIYDCSSDWNKITYNGQTKFVKKEDCYLDILRYREISYDEKEIGKIHFIELGYFNNFNINIQTVAEGAEYEGTGDQKVHISYLNGDTTIEKPIGQPLNYIIEAVVNESTVVKQNGDNVYRHLLVYYADPALRKKYKDRNECITYPSQKYPGQTWTEWVDLGPATTRCTGILHLTEVQSLNDLKDNEGHWIPPEELPQAGTEIPINPNAAGWGVTVKPQGEEEAIFYCYDYDSKEWYSAGGTGSGSLQDADSVIVKSVPNDQQMPSGTSGETLVQGGFWFAQENAYCIK